MGKLSMNNANVIKELVHSPLRCLKDKAEHAVSC